MFKNGRKNANIVSAIVILRLSIKIVLDNKVGLKNKREYRSKFLFNAYQVIILIHFVSCARTITLLSNKVYKFHYL